MQEIKRSITEEQYDELVKLPYSEQEEKLFPNGIPIHWACGYGYYGHSLRVEGSQCYAVFSLGDSCD